MTRAQEILDYLWSIASAGATNGNDRQAPVLRLERYGTLVSTVAFYYLADDGRLELLHHSTDPV